MFRAIATLLISFFIVSHVYAFKFFEEPVPEELKQANTIDEWLIQGRTQLSMRAQYNELNTTGLEERGAQALTFRTRLKVHSAEWNYLSFGLVASDIRAIPDDSSYFDGANGELDDLYVAAPVGPAVNEAWLGLDMVNTRVKYGRQAYQSDDGRLIGQSDFDQLEHSLAGVTLKNSSLNVTRVSLAHFHQLRTGARDQQGGAVIHDISANYAHLHYLGFIHSRLSAYYLGLDADDSNNRWDTRTYGLRFGGEINSDFNLHYLLEYARQSSAGQNPLDYDARYYALELGAGIHQIDVKLGQSLMGADGLGFFISPLADLRRFQGWSNQFENNGLGNVAGGIQDRYMSVSYEPLERLSTELSYHWFSPDDEAVEDRDWGEELNIAVGYAFDALQLSLNYARFDGEAVTTDAESLWLSLGYSL